MTNIFDKIKDEVKIEDYAVSNGIKKQGNGYLCPFHDDKRAGSFTFYKSTNRFYCFSANCGANGTIIDYAMRLHNIDEFEAVKEIAKEYNIDIPKGDYSYKNIWSDFKEFCRQELENSQEGQKYIQKRHLKGCRQFGYLDSQTKLVNHLKEKGYSQQEIQEVSNSMIAKIGDTHKLLIFYPKGFKARALTNNQPDKYLNSRGLEKSKVLFNLQTNKTADKTFYIFEGEINAVLFEKLGFDNSVSINGSYLSENQAKILLDYGNKFYLFLDTENKEGTEKGINLLLEEAKKANKKIEIKVLGYPERDKKEDGKDWDLGDFFEREYSKIQEVKDQIIKSQKVWFSYLITEKAKGIYSKIEDVETCQFELKNYAHGLALGLNNQTDIDLLYTNLEPLGITKESFINDLNEAKARVFENKAKDRLKNTVKKAQENLEKENIGEVLNSLKSEIEKLDQDVITIKANPLSNAGLDYYLNKIAHQPNNIKTSFKIGYNNNLLSNLEIPVGGLSIVAGVSGHGKTTMLINLALDILINYPDKKIHFITYEEGEAALFTKFFTAFLDKDEFDYKKVKSELKSYVLQSNNGADKNIITKLGEFQNQIKDRFKITYLDTDIVNLIGMIKAVNQSEGVDVLFVDYIQKIPNLSKFQSRQLEIKDIAEKLKNLSVDLNIPVITGCQFDNKQTKQEADIGIDKARESGDIVNESSLFLGLWNRAFTKENDLQRDGKKAHEADKGYIYIEELKKRDEESGKNAVLRFKNTLKIENQESQINNQKAGNSKFGS